jgi:hypothetical protein
MGLPCEVGGFECECIKLGESVGYATIVAHAYMATSGVGVFELWLKQGWEDTHGDCATCMERDDEGHEWIVLCRV